MKNILQENMRRFGTKNLAEGFMDIARLATYKDEFETILTRDQSEDVINSTIESMIQNMGGPAEAAELMQGALQSVDRIKGLLKPIIDKVSKDEDGTAAPLNVSTLTRVVDRLPFDEETKEQLNRNVIKLAQDLDLRITS